MQSYLIVSANADFINREIEKIKSKLNVSSYNLHEITPVPSIGIEEVRKIQQILSRKPYRGGDRVIIIREMEKATQEAGNAMLKMIEEPPKGTQIILTAENPNRILSTIISRCQIISDRESVLTQIFKNEKTAQKLISEILQSSPGQRVLISAGLAKSKEDTAKLLADLTSCLRRLLYNQSKEIKLKPSEIASLLTKVTAARSYVEKNVNYKAILDILFLGFPRPVS